MIRDGKDRIALIREGEIIITPEQVPALKEMLKNLNEHKSIPKYNTELEFYKCQNRIYNAGVVASIAIMMLGLLIITILNFI